MNLSRAARALVLTPEEVLVLGFEVIVPLPTITTEDNTEHNVHLFKSFFGPSPTTISFVWNDIISMPEEVLGITAKDKTIDGFKKFMRSLHFLWAYPKNAVILAYTTGTKPRMVEGDYLWDWVKVIAGLKVKVISWPEHEYSRSDRFILLTVDGVDFRTWEQSTNDYNVDPKTCSHKHKHGALKYEIGVDAYLPKIVWIHGPFRGGEHDKNIFSRAGGLKEKIPEGKVLVCDRVYSDKKANNNSDLALPNLGDSKALHEFKSRLLSRHESLNGRLKKFRILDDTYHHDPKKHVFALEAVAVLVQYAMDHGHPIFDANTVDPDAE